MKQYINTILQNPTNCHSRSENNFNAYKELTSEEITYLIDERRKEWITPDDKLRNGTLEDVINMRLPCKELP